MISVNEVNVVKDFKLTCKEGIIYGNCDSTKNNHLNTVNIQLSDITELIRHGVY